MIKYKIDDGLKLLNIAEDDLETCKYLYSKKLYPQSLFHYQQSVEKSFKTMFFSMGLLSYIEMEKDISHNPLNIFKLVKKRKKESINGLDKLHLKFPEVAKTKLMNKLSNFYKHLDIDKIMEFFKISKKAHNDDKEIKYIINSLNDIYTDTMEINNKGKNSDFLKELILIINSSIVDMIKEFFESLNFYPKLSGDEEKKEIILDSKKLINLFQEIAIPFFTTSVFLVISLIMISFLTKSLASKSRYIKKNYNPLEFYNSSHPLIMNIKELLKLQNKNLNLLGKWLDYLEKTPEYLKEILWVLKKK